MFAYPLFLLGLAASAIPIALHLLNRRNPKPFQFSTLRFLQQAIAKTRKSRQITQLLVLLLRMAILALLALAFAQPRVRSSSWLPDGPRIVVMVLDGSASMRWRAGEESNYDLARHWALELLSDLREQDKVAVVVSGRSRPRIVFPAVSNHGLAAKAVRETTCGFGRTNAVHELHAILAATVEAHRHEAIEVHYFSDFQDSTWQHQDVESVADLVAANDIRLFLNRIEATGTGNAWIRNLILQPPAILGQGDVTARARIETDDEYAGSTVMRLSLQGKEVAQRGVALGPGMNEEHSVRGKIDAEGDFALGRVSLDSDPLGDDNVWYFALERRDQIQVLLVNGGPTPAGGTADTFYLRHALNPGKLESPLIRAQTIEWAQVQATDLSRYQAVFIANLPALTAAAALKLELYVENGGHLVLYPGDQPEFLASAGKLKVLRNLRGKEQVFPRTVRFKTIASAGDDPIERRLLNVLPQPPSFSGSRRLLLRYDEEQLRTCVEHDTGTALMASVAHGRGEIWVSSLAATRDWSEWPMHPAFVILHQLLARRSFSRQLRTAAIEVGAGASIPWAGKDLELTADMTAPDGSRERLSLSRRSVDQAFLVEGFTMPGHYRLQLRANVPETRYVAVNLPAVESRVAAVTPAALEAQFAPATVYQPRDLDAQKNLLANMTHGHALWPYLLLLAFLLGIGEELFANVRSWSKAAPTTLKQLLKRRRA